jgi:opacity protein-like surface antigen
MKKLFLLAVVAVLGMSSMNAQRFTGSVDFGLPMGDIKDSYTFNIAVQGNYLWEVADEFEAGVTAGYSHYLGDSVDVPILGSIDIDDAGFLPIGGAARYNLSDEITVGAD